MTGHRLAVIACIAIAVLALAVAAYAQRAQQGGNQGGPPGGPGMMGPMGPRMGGPGGGSMAVSDGAVFILMGGTLYKYSADTLELMGRVELPLPEPPEPLAPPGVP